jgi:hypothetical protein
MLPSTQKYKSMKPCDIHDQTKNPRPNTISPTSGRNGISRIKRKGRNDIMEKERMTTELAEITKANDGLHRLRHAA